MHEATDEVLEEFSPVPYVVPSSGMIIIQAVLAAFRESEITLASFNHTGWELHPFEAESRLERFVEKGDSMDFSGSGLTVPSSEEVIHEQSGSGAHLEIVLLLRKNNLRHGDGFTRWPRLSIISFNCERLIDV